MAGRASPAVSDHDLIAEVALTERTIRAGHRAAAGPGRGVRVPAARDPLDRRAGSRCGRGVRRRPPRPGDGRSRCAPPSGASTRRRTSPHRFPKLHAALACGLVGLPGVRAFLLGDRRGRPTPPPQPRSRRGSSTASATPGSAASAGSPPAELAELPFADVAPLAGAATPGEITRRTRPRSPASPRTRSAPRPTPPSCTKVELVPGLGDRDVLRRGAPARRPGDGRLRAHRPARPGTPQRRRGPRRPRHRHPARRRVRRPLAVAATRTASTAGAGEHPRPHRRRRRRDHPTASARSARPPSTGSSSLAERTGGVVTTVRQTPVTCPGRAPRRRRTTTRTTPRSATKRTLALRNQVCVFPGCVRPTTVCDLDHTVPWPHGPTCMCNLGPLCRHHHRLKTHDPGWSLTNHGNGTYTWTTPHGTRHTVTPG